MSEDPFAPFEGDDLSRKVNPKEFEKKIETPLNPTISTPDVIKKPNVFSWGKLLVIYILASVVSLTISIISWFVMILAISVITGREEFTGIHFFPILLFVPLCMTIFLSIFVKLLSSNTLSFKNSLIANIIASIGSLTFGLFLGPFFFIVHFLILGFMVQKSATKDEIVSPTLEPHSPFID